MHTDYSQLNNPNPTSTGENSDIGSTRPVYPVFRMRSCMTAIGITTFSLIVIAIILILIGF